jgi:hypothetical protein
MAGQLLVRRFLASGGLAFDDIDTAFEVRAVIDGDSITNSSLAIMSPLIFTDGPIMAFSRTGGGGGGGVYSWRWMGVGAGRGWAWG